MDVGNALPVTSLLATEPELPVVRPDGNAALLRLLGCSPDTFYDDASVSAEALQRAQRHYGGSSVELTPIRARYLRRNDGDARHGVKRSDEGPRNGA